MSCSFIIQEDDTLFYCIVCNCRITGKSNIDVHTKGRYHSFKYPKYQSSIAPSSTHDWDCNLCRVKIIGGYKNVHHHVLGSRHRHLRKSIYKSPANNNNDYDYHDDNASHDDYDDCCDSDDDSYDDSDYDSYASDDIFVETDRSFILEYRVEEFYCILCDYWFFGDDEVRDHLWRDRHKQNVRKYGSDIERSQYYKYSYYCHLCECRIPSPQHVNQHVKGFGHETCMKVRNAVARINTITNSHVTSTTTGALVPILPPIQSNFSDCGMEQYPASYPAGFWTTWAPVQQWSPSGQIYPISPYLTGNLTTWTPATDPNYLTNYSAAVTVSGTVANIVTNGTSVYYTGTTVAPVAAYPLSSTSVYCATGSSAPTLAFNRNPVPGNFMGSTSAPAIAASPSTSVSVSNDGISASSETGSSIATNNHGVKRAFSPDSTDSSDTDKTKVRRLNPRLDNIRIL